MVEKGQRIRRRKRKAGSGRRKKEYFLGNGHLILSFKG